MAMHVNVLYRFCQKPRDLEFTWKNIIQRAPQLLDFPAVLMSLEERMLVKEYVSSNWVHQLLPRDHKRVRDFNQSLPSTQNFRSGFPSKENFCFGKLPSPRGTKVKAGSKKKIKKINHDNYFTKLFQTSKYGEGSGKCRLSRQQAEPPRSMTFSLLKCMSVCKREALPIRTECTFPY